MNKLCLAICASVAGAMLHLPAASAAAAEYQVTGPILELTDTVITVQKGKERWQITRDPTTKVTGDLKVGAKVTVYYTMTAKSIEVKPEAGKEAKKP